MVQKDAQLSTILEKPDMHDDLKEKLYYGNLEWYLNLKEQKDSQVPTVQLAQKTNKKKAMHELPTRLS